MIAIRPSVPTGPSAWAAPCACAASSRSLVWGAGSGGPPGSASASAESSASRRAAQAVIDQGFADLDRTASSREAARAIERAGKDDVTAVIKALEGHTVTDSLKHDPLLIRDWDHKFVWASAIADGARSTPVTTAPFVAKRARSTPAPQPTSSTRLPLDASNGTRRSR